MATSTTSTKKTFRIAVMLDEVQFSDIIGIDLIGSLSTAYVSTVASMDPSFSHLLDLAIPMEIYFLSTSLAPTGFTLASFRYLPNMTYDTCPRDLDLVLTGGPFLSHRPESATRFIREAWEKTPTWITTCTGSLWLADAGVLDGKRATTNRGFLGVARELHKNVEWVDQRWVVSEKQGGGELWTSGGAGAGKLFSFSFSSLSRSLLSFFSLPPPFFFLPLLVAVGANKVQASTWLPSFASKSLTPPSSRRCWAGWSWEWTMGGDNSIRPTRPWR